MPEEPELLSRPELSLGPLLPLPESLLDVMARLLCRQLLRFHRRVCVSFFAWLVVANMASKPVHLLQITEFHLFFLVE